MELINFKEVQERINVNTLKNNVAHRLDKNAILPKKEDINSETVVDHTSEPIKNIEDIFKISRFLIREKRYRDNMLFIVGINFGLRVSDLRMLRFGDLINDNYTFKESFAVFEKKTRNTRKKKKNRYITINQAVIEAVTLYLENTKGESLSDYMFTSNSNNGRGENKPLTNKSIDRILKNVADYVGLKVKISTHTLRKTFCYHQMLMSNNSSRKLLLLQKMLNHSSPAQTLDYIGITSEEITEAYKKLNLGSGGHNYIVDSAICEEEIHA